MLAPGAYQAIRIERRERGVVLARLNRPEKRNAFDDTMHGELAQLPRHAGSLDSRCDSSFGSSAPPAPVSATWRAWAQDH